MTFFFWSSHVTRRRIDEFLGNVAKMLRPGGTFFFLDSLKEHTSSTVDHVFPSDDEEVLVRRLHEGRECSIIKNFWNSNVLATTCRRAGLDVHIRETEDYWLFGAGTRTSAPVAS